MCWRCSDCGVSWPYTIRFTECPLCEEGTDKMADYPSEDWEDRLASHEHEEILAATPSTTEAKIGQHRLDRFMRAGLDLGRSLAWANDRTVDLHEFESLLKSGCDIETAAKIVAPL